MVGKMYALINTSKQVVVSTTTNFFNVPNGYKLIECPDDVSSGTQYINGEFVIEQTTQSLDDAKEYKLEEINRLCDSILNVAISTYPETEVLTFDQQTSEATKYLQTKNPEDVPLLSALALGRGITLDDLVQRVMVKHTAFSMLSGYIIGQRQALEDKLDECETVEDVEAIVVDIKLPDTSQEEVTEE